MQLLSRFFLVASSCFLAVPAHADPLAFIPDNADFIIKIENPRKLADAIRGLDAFKQAERLEAVRKALDTAEVRRFFEFVAYYERDFGGKWPDLLDRLAGGGIAIGGKIGDSHVKPPADKEKPDAGVKVEIKVDSSTSDDPVLVAIQAKDEAVLVKFVERATEVFEQEVIGAGSKEKLTKEEYLGSNILHFGKDLHVCRVNSTLLIGNKAVAVKKSLDWHRSTKAAPEKIPYNSKSVSGARKLLPPNPLIWFWYNLNYLKTRPEAKEVLTTPRNNTGLTFLFAGYLDVARRADFICGGLYKTKNGFSFTIRMPAGRQGMADDVELHLPRDPKVGGTLPLLEPSGVIFSHSFYMDAGALWAKHAIMTGENVKQFEKGVKDASRFLPGTSVDKLLTQSGVHHRIVAVQRPPTAGYTVQPQVRIPAFAFVTTMRDPAFAKSVEVMIRGGVALASTQVAVKLFEEKHGDVPLFGYRFPEDGKFPNDPQGIRFNFTPTYAVVKDQVVLASTKELCIELIDILQKEDGAKRNAPNMQMRIHSKGVADLLNASPEQVLTQTILSQAVSEAEAKKQVDQLLKYIQSLGSLRIETDYTDKDFRFDIDWKVNK